jgi:transposase
MPAAVFVRPLAREEFQEIKRLFRASPDPRVRRRANIIRLSALGYGASEIARIEGVALQTVLTWIRRFEAQGVSSLADRPRGGRPPRVDATYLQQMRQAVLSDPKELGYPFSTWSLERLAMHLAHQTGISVSAAHLSRLLHRHQIVFRRPKHDLSHKRPRREYELKREVLEFLKKNC